MSISQFDNISFQSHAHWPLFLSVAILFAICKCVAWKFRGETKSVGWHPVPQPRSLPIIGNLLQIGLKEPLTSLHNLAQRYKDCFRIDLPRCSLVIVNSQRIYNEVCNTRRFHKEPAGALFEARVGASDGLLTAFTHEENYQVAHNILAASFSANGVFDYFDDIYATTCLLVDSWIRRGPESPFDPMHEFRKFSLDNIAQCICDLQLNSVKSGNLHPFSPAVTFFMAESGKRALRPGFVNRLLRRRNKRYWEAITQLHSTAWEAINKRKASGQRRNDALDVMLHYADPKTGKKLSDEAVMYNTAALLGTGYEAPASVLTWTLIMLLKNPECCSKLKEELDDKLGGEPVTKETVGDLPYLLACIRETLRLYPSSPAQTLKLREEACPRDGPGEGLGDEQFMVKRSDIVRINLCAMQRDPEVWGDDSDEFKPERMLEENFDKLPRNVWKPFGHGVRMCSGRNFALLEAQVVIATLMQNFDFVLTDDRCNVRIGDTINLAAIDCAMVAIPKRKEENVEQHAVA